MKSDMYKNKLIVRQFSWQEKDLWVYFSPYFSVTYHREQDARPFNSVARAYWAYGQIENAVWIFSSRKVVRR